MLNTAGAYPSFRATAEYLAAIVADSTCAGYSEVKMQFLKHEGVFLLSMHGMLVNHSIAAQH